MPPDANIPKDRGVSLRSSLEPSFACGNWSSVRLGYDGMDREVVVDPSSGLVTHHEKHGCSTQEQWGRQVHGDYRIPVIARDGNSGCRSKDASRIDEDFESAKAFSYHLDNEMRGFNGRDINRERVELLWLGEISVDRQNFRPLSA
jgi:hypothetical protein